MKVPRLSGVLLTAALVGALAAACSSVTVTSTERSGIAQELVVRSLERAVARLETKRLEGRRVTLDLFGLTKDGAFAREFLTAKLQARGVDVVKGAAPADLKLKVFASVLGIDQSSTLLGLPALQVPVVSVPIPEIALFKWTRNRGHTELVMFAFDAATGRFVEQIPEGVGRSKYDQLTVLILVSFTLSDLDERPESDGAR